MLLMKQVLDGLEAVLFDLDGTLVETNIDFSLMKREMLALADRLGVDSKPARDMDILAIVDYIEDNVDSCEDDTRAQAPREVAMRILQDIELVHSENATEMASARELIEALRLHGVKIGIVTRNCRQASEISLKASGLGADFIMLAREDVRKTKPHPDHLLDALSLLGASPGRSAMVGDHWMDVEGGKAARMRTIGLLSPDRPRDFFDTVRPDAVVESLREMLDAFIDLNS
jgi:phosphoglycolate phosphatase